MSILLWKAKRIQRRIDKLDKSIDKFNRMLSKIKQWKAKDQKELMLVFKQLSEHDKYLFLLQTGQIDNEQYMRYCKK